MRRADRLFQIIQILRRSTRPVTAAALAQELEVSKRTVYRDVADLIGQRVPVEGEAGLGYLLASDYDMPPLMLTPDEIEAVVLGAQSVAGRADKALAKAAGANRMLVPFGCTPSWAGDPDKQPDTKRVRTTAGGTENLATSGSLARPILPESRGDSYPRFA